MAGYGLLGDPTSAGVPQAIMEAAIKRYLDLAHGNVQAGIGDNPLYQRSLAQGYGWDAFLPQSMQQQLGPAMQMIQQDYGDMLSGGYKPGPLNRPPPSLEQANPALFASLMTQQGGQAGWQQNLQQQNTVIQQDVQVTLPNGQTATLPTGTVVQNGQQPWATGLGQGLDNFAFNIPVVGGIQRGLSNLIGFSPGQAITTPLRLGEMGLNDLHNAISGFLPVNRQFTY